MNAGNSQFRSSSMAWMQLLRVPNLPSALSNVLMGFLLVHGSWHPTQELFLLLVASAGFYLGGMVLNDFFDYEIDLKQRPSRPLPSGAIDRRSAGIVGFSLLVLGLACCVMAGWIAQQRLSAESPNGGGPIFRCAMVGVALAIAVWLYDGPLKRTVLAPWVMGKCRFLNVLLGASVFTASQGGPTVLGFPLVVVWLATAIGVLIAGTTLLGRREALEEQNHMSLWSAVALIVLGLVGIATIVVCPQTAEVSDSIRFRFPLFVALISFPIVRRSVEAAWVAKPKEIQTAVVAVLRSLIVLDAAVCYYASPEKWFYAVVVLALILPSQFLGRFLRST